MLQTHVNNDIYNKYYLIYNNILDDFGIVFIPDINSVLIEFILWDQRLLKGFIWRNILRD